MENIRTGYKTAVLVLPGTCLYCCHGCTPPPLSGLETECKRCCAGLCCLWPGGKEGRKER